MLHAAQHTQVNGLSVLQTLTSTCLQSNGSQAGNWPAADGQPYFPAAATLFCLSASFSACDSSRPFARRSSRSLRHITKC